MDFSQWVQSTKLLHDDFIIIILKTTAAKNSFLLFIFIYSVQNVQEFCPIQLWFFGLTDFNNHYTENSLCVIKRKADQKRNT